MKNIFVVLLVVIVGVFAIVSITSNSLYEKGYDIYEVDLSDVSLEMFSSDDRGDGSSFEYVKGIIELRGDELIFATNGGMFHQDRSPVGLFVENGEELFSINTDDGEGNFFLKPNGVFYTDENGGHVVTTEEYLQVNPSPDFATQSGPMLLVDGIRHDAFRAESENRFIRSGICTDSESNLFFVLSNREMNFFDFATIFQVHGCREALYLDGFISKMYAPEINFTDLEGNFGPVITIIK